MKHYYWLIFLLFLASCHQKKVEKPPPAPFPVQIAEAMRQEMPIFLEALGHVDPIISIQIRSRIEGELTGVFFTQGQDVKKGDLLFTIDPKPYQAALKQAQGTLEESLANLALAEEKVKRYRTLAKDEYYAQIDYETLQADFAALSAQVQQNQGQLDSAAINLDYCWIYAPIDGRTGILQTDLGNLVKNDDDTPLVTLNQMAPIFVTLSIPEFQLPLVQKYHRMSPLKVWAAFDDFKGSIFVGSLSMIDNQVDPQTGMIKIRALFENDNTPLWPGQFIRTRLILANVPDAVVIPHAAIQLTQTGPVVFVVKEDMTVEERKLKLGQREDEKVMVLEGIQPGEKIVVEGQINLSSGTKVFFPGAHLRST